MDKLDLDRLAAAALEVAGRYSASDECTVGGVGAALLADSGDVFTGVCIDARCSLGFCAEHAAIAEMLKRRQTRIVAIVAVTPDGKILAPCGRCRELIRQVDPANWDTKVVLANETVVRLADLLPYSEPAGSSRSDNEPARGSADSHAENLSGQI
jgi:cytidine deaminase